MYKIFLDKNKTFECNVKIEGASLDQSEARLFLESENFTLTFKGKINSDGTVKIPINKLKGILKEDFTGKISLEVIAEDTVFKPWESEYHTDLSKKVQVNIDESLFETEEVVAKPKITFTLRDDAFDSKPHLNEIFKILEKNKVNKKTLYNNQKTFNKLVETYCQLNDIIDIKNINNIKKELLNDIK
jgi:hypothetical protein